MAKYIRRAIAVLLAVTALIIAVLPAGSANAATSTHGDFEYDGNTVVKYLGDATSVTVPNWVNRIGKDAFSGNTTLQKIVLPDSVSTIDFAAFENCTNLQEAYIPDSVRTIGSSAFSGCKSLQNISIPAKTENIGSGAFAGCAKLATVPINELNPYYTCQDGVIYSKDGRELVQYLAGRPFSTYTMPETINRIDEYAFWGANNLKDVSISSSVDAIPEYAFDNCNGLIKVSLPRSVERINAFSFADCSNLVSINIPDTVGYIDENAFYMTNGARVRFVDANGNAVKIVAAEDADDYINGEAVEDVPDVDSNVTPSEPEPSETNEETIEQEAIDFSKYNGSFSGEASWVSDISNTDYTQNLTPNDIAGSKVIGGNVMVMIPHDTKINAGYDLLDAESEDNYADSALINNTQNRDKDVIGDIFAKYTGNEPIVSLDEGVTKIADRAFYNNEAIRDVSLPETIQAIGDFAFARTNIRNMIIPEGTTDIGYGAFYNCNILENIYIPTTLENVELGAFDGTRWLDDWKHNPDANDFLVVGDRILLAYKGSESNIAIPDGIYKIAPGAFYNNTNIKSVMLPSTVNTVGEDAFNGCTNLNQLTLNEGLVNINDRAFCNTALTTVYIPDSVANVGLGAFDTTGNNGSLETVIFKGEDIPNVSFNDTASRVSAHSLRSRAFEGVDNAIVSKNANFSSGNLFDPMYLGFNGAIYSVNTANKDDNGLILEKALVQPDESGNVIINPNVSIGAEKYIMNNVKPDAFNEYLDYGRWCDNPPTNISISGNTSSSLNSLLGEVNNSLNPGAYSKSPGIKVTLNGNVFPSGDYATASIPGDNNGYVMSISENTDDRDAINDAFNYSYGINPDGSAVYISIDLFDESGIIPIHKIGKNKMEISIPVPTPLDGKDNITVCSLDDNGLLSELSSSVSTVETGNRIDFVTAHCSYFIIFSKQLRNVTSFSYTNGEISEDEAILAATGEVVDSSIAQGIGVFSSNVVNTLHKKTTTGIEVKWFIVVILFATSGILALYKPRKKA